MKPETCPICEVGELVPKSHIVKLPYKGVDISVGEVEYSECNSCSSDPVLSGQAKRNQVRFADAKRDHEGLLLSSEIKSIRKLLGLTQRKASSKFGGGLNAFSKYERGEVIQSEPMDKLLRVACEVEGVYEYLSSNSHFKPVYRLPFKGPLIKHPFRFDSKIADVGFVPSFDAVIGTVRSSFSAGEWVDNDQKQSFGPTAA